MAFNSQNKCTSSSGSPGADDSVFHWCHFRYQILGSLCWHSRL